MPTNRGASRRTHNLGGCTTCRRRHLKCDQTRPRCTVCRDSKLQCGGFPSQIRWASMSTGPPVRKESKNGSEASIPRDVGFTSTKNVVSAQNDMFENEGVIEATAGPSTFPPTIQSTNIDGLPFEQDEPDLSNYPSNGPFSDLESLLGGSNGLGWSDLFDPGFAFSMPFFPHQDDDPLGLLSHVATQQPYATSEFPGYESRPTPNSNLDRQNTDTVPAVPDFQPPPHTADEIDDAEILEDSKILLKHFRDIVIPQFAPLPSHSKSPWEVLNWSGAVQTHSDMTYLMSTTVNHANKANLYAILACSAYSIEKAKIYPAGLSNEKTSRILEYVGTRAKCHMQESLRTETSGPSKAKYKEQLMAILSLIALTTMTGDIAGARCHLVHAERLLRLRGLAKRELSRRARLLHHVYTWHRIIGESTFALHDHSSSSLHAKVENIIKQHCRYDSSMSSSEQNTPAVEEYFQLDDFLRVEVHGTDSDPDVDASKDQEAGIRDIHLVDLRQWSKTLFMDIYGIPEVWLSLLSQTTRVANVIDLLEQTPTQASRGFTNSLQRRMNRLEHIICTFSAQQSSTLSQSLSQSNDSQIISATHKASLALLRAMSSALVILFYRRVRKVHPFILQSHVDDVIKALEEFDLAQGDADTGSLIPGTPWPAFIAGCEAISTPSRDRYIKWLQKGALHSAFNGFASSQQVMRRVWERRDTGNKAPEEVNMQIPSHNKGDVYSWVDVLREENFWLMLY